MRELLNTLEHDEFRFHVEIDTGSHENGEVVVWVSQNGVPLERIASNIDGTAYQKAPWPIQYRQYFPISITDTSIKNFCRKFARDEAYRKHKMTDFFEGTAQ